MDCCSAALMHQTVTWVTAFIISVNLFQEFEYTVFSRLESLSPNGTLIKKVTFFPI